MPQPVKLASALPAEYRNGLISITRELVDAPEDQRIAFIVYDVKRVEHDTDSESDVPTVRVRRIEIPLPLDRAAAWDMLERATKARIGETSGEQLAFGDDPR